jgi:hypothetical protein
MVRTINGLLFLFAVVLSLSAWAPESWRNPNHTPLEYFPQPVRTLCLDRSGALWWERSGTISVATDLGVGRVTALDTLELGSTPLDGVDSVQLFVPRTVSGVYALTKGGRLLSLSFSGSGLSVTELADFGMVIDWCSAADDSSQTIVARTHSYEGPAPFKFVSHPDVYLIDLPSRTISTLPLPESASGERKHRSVRSVGNSRFLITYSDGTTFLFDSREQDGTAAINVVNEPVPYFVETNRSMLSWNKENGLKTICELAVENWGAFRTGACWEIFTKNFETTDYTWLDDQRLLVARRELCTTGDGILRTDHGEIVVLERHTPKQRQLNLDFEPWSLFAISSDRLAVGDRDGGVHVIQIAN